MRYPLEKYKYFTYFDKEKNCEVVVAVSTYGGKVVRGIAKCDPRDTYSVENGKKLAAARCNLKIAEKRAKRAKQKSEAAAKALQEASTHYSNMVSYYTDSIDELNEAHMYLGDLLSFM